MASSSDWMGAIQTTNAAPTQMPAAWMGVSFERSGFVEGLPLMRPALPKPDHEDSMPEFKELAPEDEPDALDMAFAQGEAAGRAAAQAEFDEERENQRALRLNFRNLDAAAMDALAKELAETVIALCSQALVEFTTDAPSLAKRCEAAAHLLGSAAQDAALHLHPNDIELLDPDWAKGWRIVPDESLARAGLRFESKNASVSDCAEDWNRAIAAALRG